VIFLFFLGAAYDHLRFDGYFWNQLGMEYPALWGLVALYFACAGGGAISLDRLFVGGPSFP
jgi:putative oxidoreductase